MSVIGLFALVTPAQAFYQCSSFFTKIRTASAISSDALSRLQNHLTSEEQQGVPASHQTEFLIHHDSNGPIKTDRVVVIYHGLMNSPRDTRFLARDLHKMGFNVVNARLDGHYERRRNELDFVDYKDWIHQLDDYHTMAQLLGRHVVVLGHSAGGLAAVHTGVTESVSQLILLTPALKVQPKIETISYMASTFGISGWILDSVGLGKDRYTSTKAGVEVAEWGSYLRDLPSENGDGDYGFVKDRLAQTPTLLIDLQVDPTIDANYNRELTYDMENVDYRTLKDPSVEHRSIAVPRMNKDYGAMLSMIQQFLTH